MVSRTISVMMSALVIALGGWGCTRPIGTVLPGGPDGGVDASPDASTKDGQLWDAASPTDGACDEIMAGACSVGSLTTIEAQTAPRFAFDVETMADGRILVTGAEGWTGKDNLVVWILSPTTELPVDARATVEGDWLSAGAAPTMSTAALLRHTEAGATDVIWMDAQGGSIDLSAPTNLCEQCFPAFKGPVVKGGTVAVAVEHQQDSSLDIGLIHRNQPVTWVTSDSGDEPELVALDDRVMAVYHQNQDLVAQVISWDGQLIVGPTPLGLAGITGDFGLLANDGTVVLWAFRSGEPLGDILEVNLDQDAQVTSQHEYSKVASLPMGLSVCRRLTVTSVVWGEMTGPCGAGVHGMLVLAGRQAPLAGPALISNPIKQSTSTYSLWPGCVSSAGGGLFTVIWGGWQTDANYALYGRSIQCLE
ncbi:MAG: hypothetical protein J7M25_09410 [Deltaproteobacteria bacterium]|nr:hypothetical protein [Deltaproteobacteria bacterium]